MNLARTLLATALAVVGLSLPVVPSGAAAPPTVPRAVYLVGLDLHLVGERRVQVRLPAGLAGSTALLGRTAGGWVVAAGEGYYLVGRGGAAEWIADRPGELYQDELLSREGRYLVVAVTDAALTVSSRAFDLQERRWLRVPDVWEVGGGLADVAGDRVLVAGEEGLFAPRIGSGGTGQPRRLLAVPTDLVDVGHDVAFVRTSTDSSYGRYGPTSLSAPGTPRWLARRFDPVAVSPQGTYVLGYDGRVLRLRDGRPVREVPGPRERPADERTRVLGWADEHHVLHVDGVVGGRASLVECPVPRGACHRVAGPTGAAITLPTSHAGPSRRP